MPTRIFEVGFAHKRYGAHWCARRVAARNAEDAIKRAKAAEEDGHRLVAMSVRLLAETN